MRTLSCFAVVFALALLTPPALRGETELVINGGFETGDFSGWTQSGDTSITGAFSGYVHSGSYAAYFGPVGGLGFITQTQALATVAGQTYELSFWLANDGGTPNEWLVSWAGAELIHEYDRGGFPWTEYVFSVVAPDATTDLTFGFFQRPAFYYLDDVSVVSGVPEPATLLLLGGGLLAMAALRRRR